MQVLKVQLANGREILVPDSKVELPDPILEMAISMNVPALQRRHVRIVAVVLGGLCCDCMEHLIACPLWLSMN